MPNTPIEEVTAASGCASDSNLESSPIPIMLPRSYSSKSSKCIVISITRDGKTHTPDSPRPNGDKLSTANPWQLLRKSFTERHPPKSKEGGEVEIQDLDDSNSSGNPFTGHSTNSSNSTRRTIEKIPGSPITKGGRRFSHTVNITPATTPQNEQQNSGNLAPLRVPSGYKSRPNTPVSRPNTPVSRPNTPMPVEHQSRISWESKQLRFPFISNKVTREEPELDPRINVLGSNGRRKSWSDYIGEEQKMRKEKNPLTTSKKSESLPEQTEFSFIGKSLKPLGNNPIASSYCDKISKEIVTRKISSKGITTMRGCY